MIDSRGNEQPPALGQPALGSTNALAIDCSVSVIVPVFNSEHSVRLLLDSLLKLEFPDDRYEVLLVDNGSTDATVQVAQRYGITILSEPSIRSSYAARNLGLRHAKHGIIAFTDADCVVNPRWIAEGVATMQAERADLVAGRIEFTFPDRPTAGQLYDSLVHMRNDVLVSTKRRAVTANLFVRAEAFRTLGVFPPVQSGGDSVWTNRAVSAGYTLVYAPGAVVYHPARPLTEVLRKAHRVGGGFGSLRAGKPVRGSLTTIARALLPPAPGSARRLVETRGPRWMRSQLGRIWWVSYLYNIVWGAAALTSLTGRHGRAGDIAESPPIDNGVPTDVKNATSP